MRLVASLPVVRSCRVGLLFEIYVFPDVGRAHAYLHMLLLLLLLLDANIAASSSLSLVLGGGLLLLLLVNDHDSVLFEGAIASAVGCAFLVIAPDRTAIDSTPGERRPTVVFQA